jgi:hypothetical protein
MISRTFFHTLRKWELHAQYTGLPAGHPFEMCNRRNSNFCSSFLPDLIQEFVAWDDRNKVIPKRENQSFYSFQGIPRAVLEAQQISLPL